MTASQRSPAQDMGLFLVLALFANLGFAMAIGGLMAKDLMHGFYLIAFIHIAASLLDGAFGRVRTVTWVVLILGWTAAECLSFTDHIIPKGQLLFWLATDAPWAAAILERLAAAPWVFPAMLLVLLAVDLVSAHISRLVGRSWLWLSLLVVAATFAGAVLTGVLAQFPRPPRDPLSFEIVPPWYLLPYYSMLRAVPDKSFGVAVALISVLAPALWPWTRPRTLGGTKRMVWFVAWLAFIAAFLGLGYLGTQAPDDGAVSVARLLIGYYFLFLLVLPRIFGRIGSSAPDSPAERLP